MLIFPKIKLFYKFAMVMILLAVMPLALVSWQIYRINQQGMQPTILELHTSMVNSLADRISTYIEQINRQVAFIANTLQMQGREMMYQSFLDSNPDFISISIVRPDRFEGLKVLNPNFSVVEELLDLSASQAYRDFEVEMRANPNLEYTAGQVYFVDSMPRLDMIHPIKNNPGYTVFITVNLNPLWEEVRGMTLRKTGYTFLVDKNGCIIAHPQMSLAFEKSNVKNVPIVESALIAKTSGSSEYLNEAGEPIVGAYSPIDKLKWGVITQQNKREAYHSLYQMRARAFVFTLISIIAASLIAFFFARTLTRPILSMIKAAKQVAEGDFSAKVKLGKTRDEMMELAGTFNLMTGKLKEYADMQVDKIVAEKTKTEAIIFSIDDGLLMTDYQGNIQLVNRKAKSILNLNAVDTGFLERASIFDIIQNDEIKKNVMDVFGNPGKEFFREIKISEDYLTTFYKTSATKVKSIKGEELGVVTVFHDITLEKELDQMKDDFLHSITHDLRNPMTSIRGFIKFLIDGIGGPVNDQQKKMLQTVDRASSRLLGMINDILDIAKIESRKFDVELAETDLKELAERSREINQPQVEKKKITLSIDAPENMPKINLDPKLIDRVFQNLIGNAIKFVPDEGGSITIKLEELGKYAKISIVDNGPGIPPEYAAKIFEKFQQVQGQKKGGTGLGLTICKFIVEAHLGKIWVESEPGKGSSFIFEIPKNITKTEKGQVVIG